MERKWTEDRKQNVPATYSNILSSSVFFLPYSPPLMLNNFYFSWIILQYQLIGTSFFFIIVGFLRKTLSRYFKRNILKVDNIPILFFHFPVTLWENLIFNFHVDLVTQLSTQPLKQETLEGNLDTVSCTRQSESKFISFRDETSID